MFKYLLKNSAVKNASWLIAGRVIQMVINLFVGILTARYLAPANYGIINYAGAYTAFFMAFCTLGINSVIVKELVDAPERDGEIVGTAIGLRMISSALSAVVIIVVSSFLDAGEPTTIAVVTLSSIGLVFHVFEIFNYWFQSKLLSKRTAMATLIAYIITAIYKIILLIAGASVKLFAFATSVDYICVAIILYLFYRMEHGGKLIFSPKYGKKLLGKSYHFILTSLMVAIYGQTDKIMLKHMMGEAEVGYYSTAVALCNVWCFVLIAIIDSLNPLIMDAYNTNKEKFNRLNRLLYCIIFYVSMLVSIAFVFGGKLAIGILYGDAYLPAVAPLMVITWYTAFSYWGVARNAWIVCENKQKYLKYVYFSAAVVNVVLNLFFIPLWGAVGAAIASLVAQIVTTLVVPFFIKALRRNSVMMIEAIFFKGIK